jgi:putative ABC transport system substrate-binding protein
MADQLSGSFFPALAGFGFEEGRNLIVERRWADGQVERLSALAAEIVATKPDLIFAPPGPGAAAVKAHTSQIPTVFCFVNDPVGLGLVKSLSRPAGNLTGLSTFSVELVGKRIELLREITSRLTRLFAWYTADIRDDVVELQEVERAARLLDLQLKTVAVRTPDDIGAVLDDARRWNADGIYVVPGTTAYAARSQVVARAAELSLPAVYGNAVFVREGGLISYAVDYPDLARRAATYAAKILRGAKPADLPVEQPTKFELAINLKAAKALGLDVSPRLQQLADEVIE